MINRSFYIMRTLALFAAMAVSASVFAADAKVYTADKVADFTITGDGSNAAWTNVPWAGGAKWVNYSGGAVLADTLQGDFKVAYSNAAFYLLIKRYAPAPVFDTPGGAFTFGNCDAEFFLANPGNTSASGAYYHGCFKPAFSGVGTGDCDRYLERGGTGPTGWPAYASIESKMQVASGYYQVEVKVPFTACVADTVNTANTSLQFQAAFIGDAGTPLTRWNDPGAAYFITQPWGTLNLSGKNASVSDWSQF